MMTDEQILSCVDGRMPVRYHHGASVFEYRLFDLLAFGRAILALAPGLSGWQEIETLRVQVRQADERGDAAMERAHVAEHQVERLSAQLDRLEVSGNTVMYCYAKKPENFAAALTDFEEEAAKAREELRNVTAPGLAPHQPPESDYQRGWKDGNDTANKQHAILSGEPMFWVRLLRDGLYEGPVHHKSEEGRLLREAKPDEWRPLYLQPQPEPTSKGADGWKLVPIKPTEDMLFKMAEVDGHLRGDRDHPMLTQWEDYWNMALDASPAPPASQQREPQEAAEVQTLLKDAHNLLDGALGDTDFNTFEDEEEEREYAPIQVAARLVMQAIDALSAPQEAAEPTDEQWRASKYGQEAAKLADDYQALLTAHAALLETVTPSISAPQEAGKPCATCRGKGFIIVAGNAPGGYEQEPCPDCDPSKEAGKVEAVADERQPSDGDYLRWAEQAGAKVNWDFESASSARVVFLTASQWGRFCDKVRALYLRPSQQALGDADGDAFRKAAELGLTLRFYGGCAQSSMPGTPSAYVVVNSSDRASGMREAVNKAAEDILAAAGGSEK